MKNKRESQSSWNGDYLDFLSVEPQRPPSILTENLQTVVRKDLHPSVFVILTKLLPIQFFIGLLTLLVCPQFELSFLGNKKIFHFLLHNFGIYSCMAACGAFFIGSGAMVMSYLLKPEEIKAVRRAAFMHFPLLGLLSLFVFYFTTHQMFFDTAFIWWAGASLGGILSFYCGQKFRFWGERLI